MNKTMSMPETPDQTTPEKDVVLSSGWRVKRRAPTRSGESVDTIVSSIATRPGIAPGKSARAAGRSQSSRLQRLSRHFGVLASMGAAVVALIMVADFLSSGVEPTGISHPANAETHISTAEDQSAIRQLAISADGYQLHLGAYRSELDARLVWVGLEAYAGTTLDGMHPLFEAHRSDDGDQVFHLLARSVGGYDEADNHCAWLRKRAVTCSIVEG